MSLAVEIGVASSRDSNGAPMPVHLSAPNRSELVADGEASSITGKLGQFWRLTAIGGPRWVSFGESPDAETDTAKRRYLAEGQSADFSVGVVGEKVAVAVVS